MGSIPTPSASNWREKIVETAKKFYRKTSSLLSVVLKKIKDAGDTFVSAIRNIDIDILKESIEIFHNWFTWFLGSIFALKFTDSGKAFFSANISVMKALFLVKFISFLTTLLATLSEMHKRNIVPLILMFLFKSGASLLCVVLISRPALWISLTSWLCIFGLFGYCCYPEIKELILNIKRWFQNQNSEGSSLPVVTEATPATAG